ncbi:MAG TPA: isoprenylcysteine carboxylmethyltransferase family protein [Stellaceae bacterium]|nr:isoprenylcysteine carboxylmethyltransferase family protein [Stellaceae bacterium]
MLTLLCALALGAIAALPRLFFRSGHFSAMWWLTAAPFFAAAAFMLLGASGHLPGLWRGGAWIPVFNAAATVLAAGAISLLSFTLGTHRRPLSLWHQEDDAPAELVTEGAYARLRHPFYTSFLATLAAIALAWPSPWTAADLLCALILLNSTAAREERRLAQGTFGAAYRDYIGRTGRFLPRLSRTAS